ncbi:MAG: hypothetical protein HYU63_04805 [Armatimonadetes bacterium]|nr:hypothetical protein [Armatimonadota bacterium]
MKIKNINLSQFCRNIKLLKSSFCKIVRFMYFSHLLSTGINNRKYKHGLSILELVIALSILATGFLMILGMFPTSFSAVKQGKNIVFSTEFSQGLMDNLSSLSFDAYGISSPSPGSAVLNSMVNGVNTSTNFIYSITAAPDTQSAVQNASIKTITITIYEENKPQNYIKLETKKVRTQ